jgi:hypothetical protein
VAEVNAGINPAGGLKVRAGVQQTFSPEHLYAARLMAHLCREREDRLVAKGFIGVDYQVRSFAMTAIIEAVAVLDARVNELWQDAAITKPGVNNFRLDGLTDETVDLLRTLRRTESLERSLKLLEKFDVVLRCARKPEVDKGRRPYQDVEPLIRLRNAYVHYALERQWIDEVDDLEKRLKHLVPANPLVPQDWRPWFPHHPLCAGVAEWAWRACKLFVDEWQTQLGLTHSYLEKFPVPWPDENIDQS